MLKRIIKATITNIIAVVSPRFYIKWTGETGRGRQAESIDDIADYMIECFYDYFNQLNVEKGDISAFLENKTLLEYGPGDLPAVALVMYAYGAKKVVCVDRFKLVKLSEKNINVLNNLINKLPEKYQTRANDAFVSNANPASGFKENCISYRVTQDGIVDTSETYDLIYSRAVLEHVNYLEKTMVNMCELIKDNGLIIHQVDLKSHGLHQESPLDFLTWSSLLWWLMYSNKGVPNRWRIDHYKKLINMCKMNIKQLKPTVYAEQYDIDKVRKNLAKEFKNVSDEDLAVLCFWMILSR